MWRHYVKLAVKVLMRRKFFTFISLFAITVTLAILMTAATLLDHMLGAHSPDIHSDRTLINSMTTLRGGEGMYRGPSIGYGFLDRYARGIPGVECLGICSCKGIRADSFVDGRRIKSLVKYTDGAFWKIMSFGFLEGGPYSDRDVKETNDVAVISRQTRDRFFGACSAVGRTITFNDRRYRVVGVVEDVSSLRVIPFADLWVPIDLKESASLRTDLEGDFRGLFLARDASNFRAIQAAFQERVKSVVFTSSGKFNHLECEMNPCIDSLAGRFGIGESNGAARHIAISALLMVLFMVLPAVNLVNINMSRILERSGEIGVRKAFGASSRTLVGQFLAENLLLTLLGGILGSLATLGILHVIALSDLIPNAQFSLSLRLFFVGVVVTVFFGLFSGIYPAWRMSRMAPIVAIKGGEA